MTVSVIYGLIVTLNHRNSCNSCQNTYSTPTIGLESTSIYEKELEVGTVSIKDKEKIIEQLQASLK